MSPVNRFTVAATSLRQCARTAAKDDPRCMESIMTKTRCSTEVYELSLAELELVSGGLLHEGTHAADSSTLGGGAGGGSWLEALARALGQLENQAASRL